MQMKIAPIVPRALRKGRKKERKTGILILN